MPGNDRVDHCVFIPGSQMQLHRWALVPRFTVCANSGCQQMLFNYEVTESASEGLNEPETHFPTIVCPFRDFQIQLLTDQLCFIHVLL